MYLKPYFQLASLAAQQKRWADVVAATVVLIALCFGLRISEILGLRWTDFDFKRSIVLIQRSAVGKRLNRLKTEYSQDEVPLEKSFIAVLKKLQEICAKTEQQWVFPSPATGRPYHADSIRADYL